MNFTLGGFVHAIGGAAALSSLAPKSQAQQRRIGYCMVGLGRISMQHFMPACKMSERSQVTALVSGHRDKAEKMAAEYNVPPGGIYSYDNYDEIVNNKQIDAVYIALPSSMNPQHTIRPTKADEEVLCDNPMPPPDADRRAPRS